MTEGQDIVRVEEQSRVVTVLPLVVTIFGQSVNAVVAHGSEGETVFSQGLPLLALIQSVISYRGLLPAASAS